MANLTSVSIAEWIAGDRGDWRIRSRCHQDKKCHTRRGQPASCSRKSVATQFPKKGTEKHVEAGSAGARVCLRAEQKAGGVAREHIKRQRPIGMPRCSVGARVSHGRIASAMVPSSMRCFRLAYRDYRGNRRCLACSRLRQAKTKKRLHVHAIA